MKPKPSLPPTILLVDDDEDIRTQMKWGLAKEYTVAQAGDRADALEKFRELAPAVTLLDLGLPPKPNSTEEGMATLAAILAFDETAKVVIVSGQGDKENALQAVGSGAYDFLTKPVEMDEVEHVIRRCVHVAELERGYREMEAQLRPQQFEGILATSPQMHAAFKMIGKVAKAPAPVLILGESGTGKEMVATAIHRQSGRKGKFVAINCSAIPADLIESELFGHEKGAFTGAHAQRVGLIETAEGGTLFLDEVGELPAQVQVKLLRFLQEKRVQRVGGREELTVDARVVAATNADLAKDTDEGTFREDLYFRLAVVVLTLPPLRDRGEDPVLLARDFLNRFGEEYARPRLTFTTESLRSLQRHPWPGNVRELQNRVQRAVLMADGQRITPDDLELANDADSCPPVTLREARDNLDRRLVTQALENQRHNLSAAATDLGVSRPTLYELMDKLGIERGKKG